MTTPHAPMTMDLDVSRYTTPELLDLLELPEPFSHQDIEIHCSQKIEQYKTSHPELAKFFFLVQQRLRQEQLDEEESEESENTEDSDTENSVQSEEESEDEEHGHGQEMQHIPHSIEGMQTMQEDQDNAQESQESEESEDEEQDTQNSQHATLNSMNTQNTSVTMAQASTIHPSMASTTMAGLYPLHQRYASYANDPQSLKSNIQSTLPTEYAPGMLNPLFRKTFKRMIVIDSRFRDNYFQSNVNDFYVSFPEPIKHVVKTTVTNVDIINAHYTLSAVEGTNYMKIKLKRTDFSDIDIPITLEPGNMFSEDLSAKINEQIKLYFAYLKKNVNTLFPDDTATATLVTNHIVKCEVSTFSGRTLFTVDKLQTGINSTYTDMSFHEMQLDFTNPRGEDMPPFLSLGWILGFRNRIYKGATVYKSESIFNAVGRQAVYLGVDDFQNHQNDRISLLHQDSFFSKNLLARIPLREGKFSITFNDQSDKVERTREYYGPVDIQRLHIQLFDEYGMLFDNNNMDYSLVLEFDVLYQ